MSKEISVINEVRSSLDKMAPQFQMALPAHVPVEKFMRIVMTALQGTQKLLELDRGSLYSACMRAAQDGLLPDGREGAMVPRKGKVAWQPMVAGVMKKVRNSGEISTWDVHVVYENDIFDYQLGDNASITHKPNWRGARGEIVGAYSIVRMKDGELSREFMPIAEINGIRDRSDGYKYQMSKGGTDNPWFTDKAEMCKKTVVHRHSKRLPMSTDIDAMIREGMDAEIVEPEPVTERVIEPKTERLAEPQQAKRLKEAIDEKTGEVVPEDQLPI